MVTGSFLLITGTLFFFNVLVNPPAVIYNFFTVIVDRIAITVDRRCCPALLRQNASYFVFAEPVTHG
ncbi:hypothetical protein MEZE111188_20545 [Mesobacillus zeae]